MKSQKILGTVLLAGLLLPVAAGALTIDDFATNQATLSVAPSGPNAAWSSADTAGGDIIGFERDMHLSIAAGSSPLTSTATVQFDRFMLANDSESASLVSFQWDGNDGDPNSLDTNGLGGVDLTEGNATNAFEIRFLFDDLPATLDLTVWSGSNSSTVTWPTTGLILTSELSIFIPFDAFVGNADFTSVGAIQLDITSLTNGLDISIDYIQTTLAPVPVPPALILFGTSLLGLAIRRRR